MHKILFFLFLLVPFLSEAKSDYPMLHYTIEDGLPSNTIYDIYQDPDGLIWIGTDKGIARYNGQKFETFTTADGLADNECFFFRPDYYGRLWIGTYNGKLCYYKDGIFHNEQNTPFLKLPIKSSGTVEINLNKDSTLNFLFVDDHGITEINKETIVHHKVDYKKMDANPVKHVVKTGPTRFSIFYTYEMISIDTRSNIVQRYPYNKKTELFRYIRNLNQGYFIDSFNQVYTDIFDPATRINVNNEIQKNKIFIHKVFLDAADTIVCTTKGLFFNLQDALFREQDINILIKDNKADYWIGTAKKGLFKLSGQFRKFRIRNNLYDGTVNFAHHQENHFYYGTLDKKAYYLNSNTDSFECFSKSETLFNSRFSIQNLHYIDNNTYYNFSHGNSYIIPEINSKQKPLKKKMFTDVRTAYGIFKSGRFRYIRDRFVIYYASDSDFLSRKDSLVTGNIYVNSEKNRANIFGMASDRNNELYFSTIKQMYRIKDTVAIALSAFGNTSFREFIFSKNYLVGYTHRNELLVTANYKADHVLFDTIKSGDCVWDKFYTLNDSTLLISTNNYYRIITLHPSAGKPKYSLRLLENPFVPFQPEFLYVDSTDCYFFKNGAMSNFPITFLLQKETLPTIKFRTLKSVIGNLHITKELNLNYFDARNIAIQFTPISFDHKNLVYEYSVSDDASENWITITGEELNLSKLGYGKFRISVRAKTMSGYYSPASSFMLRISRPYWATWWFITTCILLGTLIIAYVARLGIRRSLRKKESEVRFLRSEYKALNALMNPHFIFNSLNSVQSLVNNKENARASKYIRIFSDLIRQNMRNIAQDLIPLSKELDLVENYLKIERLRFKDKLSYSFQVSEEVETDFIMIPPLLIQPLVENAIKHGIWPKKTNDGSINIMVYEKDDLLFIVIEDNGIGLNNPNKSDTLHESYAMSNIHKRTEQLSQMHQTNITVEIKEMMDENGKVLGVRSSITIKVPDNTNSLPKNQKTP